MTCGINSYNYITTEFDYSKCDSCPAAYGQEVLCCNGLNLEIFLWEHNGFTGKVNYFRIL